VVGQGLQIGDEHERLVLVLQGHAIAERADVVAEVQRSGGLVSGEDGASHGSAPSRWIPDEGVGAARAAWNTRRAAPFEAAPWIDARFR